MTLPVESKEPDWVCCETMEWVIFLLCKAGEIASAVEILTSYPDAHLLLVEVMSVKSWGYGGGMNPNESSRIPEEYDFQHPCWQTLWDYLPQPIIEKVNTYFEENQGED